MQKTATLALLLATLSLAGCHKGFLNVYQSDIQQGNVLAKEQVDQLKIGMTPSQVRFLLGSPLLADTLNPKRWDYSYSYRPGTYARNLGIPAVKNRTLSLWFEDGKLARIEGAEDIPAKQPIVPASAPKAPEAPAVPR